MPSLRSSLTFASYLVPLAIVAACSGGSSNSGSGGSAGALGTGGASSTSTSTNGGTTTPTTSTGDMGGAGTMATSTSSTGEGSTSMSSSGTGGGVKGCTGSGLPLCDDFEGATAGSAPDAAKWTVVSPDCKGAGTLAVDGSKGHSGSKSVKVSGKGGFCDHVFISNSAAIGAVGKVVYARFFVQLETALGNGHTTFLAMKDTNDGKDLRMGGQNGILMYNRELGDATLPSMSPAGIAKSVKLPTNKWSCVEFMVDQGAGVLQTWVDGNTVEGLQIDAKPTPDVDQQWLNKSWKPSLTDFRLGWESYAGQEMNLWFDDVAIGPQRIGCE